MKLPSTQGILTIADILKEKGISGEGLIPFKNPVNDFQDGLNAFAEICIVADYFQGDWVADYSNSKQYKYFPWFVWDSSGSGFRFLEYDYDWTITTYGGGARLCFPTSELATYVGKTFSDIYNRLYKKNPMFSPARLPISDNTKVQVDINKIQSIKSFRNEIDKLINSIKLLRSSREVSLTNTSLQLAFSWLGEALKETGSQTPYVNSENPGNAIIEPTADHLEGNDLSKEFSEIDQTHTARVKYMRGAIQKVLDSFKKYGDEVLLTSPACMTLALADSYKALKEAKIWLGWELGRIKKEKEGTFLPTNVPLSIEL